LMQIVTTDGVSVHGQPARRAYEMGRKLSNGFMDLFKFRMS